MPHETIREIDFLTVRVSSKRYFFHLISLAMFVVLVTRSCFSLRVADTRMTAKSEGNCTRDWKSSPSTWAEKDIMFVIIRWNSVPLFWTMHHAPHTTWCLHQAPLSIMKQSFWSKHLVLALPVVQSLSKVSCSCRPGNNIRYKCKLKRRMLCDY